MAAATAVIDAQTPTSTDTKSRVLRQIEARLAAEHGPGVVPMSPKSTAYRLLRQSASVPVAPPLPEKRTVPVRQVDRESSQPI